MSAFGSMRHGARTFDCFGWQFVWQFCSRGPSRATIARRSCWGNLEQTDHARRGSDDEAPFDIRFGIGGNHEESGTSGLITLSGSYKNFAVVKNYLDLPTEHRTCRIEFLSRLMLRPAVQVLHKEESFQFVYLDQRRL